MVLVESCRGVAVRLEKWMFVATTCCHFRFESSRAERRPVSPCLGRATGLVMRASSCSGRDGQLGGEGGTHVKRKCGCCPRCNRSASKIYSPNNPLFDGPPKCEEANRKPRLSSRGPAIVPEWSSSFLSDRKNSSSALPPPHWNQIEKGLHGFKVPNFVAFSFYFPVFAEICRGGEYLTCPPTNRRVPSFLLTRNPTTPNTHSVMTQFISPPSTVAGWTPLPSSPGAGPSSIVLPPIASAATNSTQQHRNKRRPPAAYEILSGMCLFETYLISSHIVDAHPSTTTVLALLDVLFGAESLDNVS